MKKHCNECSYEDPEGIHITGCDYCGCHTKQPEKLSKCCKKPMKVSCADEGTSCYICTKCGQPTDEYISKQPKPAKCKFCGNNKHIGFDCDEMKQPEQTDMELNKLIKQKLIDIKNGKRITPILFELTELFENSGKQMYELGKKEERKEIKKNIGSLRQWINETPDLLITDENLESFLIN